MVYDGEHSSFFTKAITAELELSLRFEIDFSEHTRLQLVRGERHGIAVARSR
jgi:hypothetical protein